MSGRGSQRKGAEGERELAAKLEEAGFPVVWGGNKSYGTRPDLRGLPGVHIECKRVEKLNISKAVEQATTDSARFNDGSPAVFHRRNKEPWLVTMPFTDWITLYRGWNQNQKEAQAPGQSWRPAAAPETGPAPALSFAPAQHAAAATKAPQLSPRAEAPTATLDEQHSNTHARTPFLSAATPNFTHAVKPEPEVLPQPTKFSVSAQSAQKGTLKMKPKYWESEKPLRADTGKNIVEYYPESQALAISKPNWTGQDGVVRHGKSVALDMVALMKCPEAVAIIKRVAADVAKMEQA